MKISRALLGTFVAVGVATTLSVGAVSAAPIEGKVSGGVNSATACGPYVNSTDTVTVNNSSIYVPVYVSGCFGSPSKTSTVTVDIQHPRRGELTIDLVAYDGTEYRLKNSNLLDWRPDVHASYRVDLSSEQINAPWFLKVTDGCSSRTGYVDSWSLSL